MFFFFSALIPAAEQRAVKSSTVKADAEALQRFVASEFRLAQAQTFLPYKRARFSLSSVSTEKTTAATTTTTPASILGQLHHGGLLSPALNTLYRAAIEHAKVTKTKLKQSFDDLTAWKFSPDSPSGKRLMTCMRQLLAKNESLGRVNEADRLASLESEAAMQATCIEEFLKTNQEESSFDLEGLQSSLLILKQQLCLAESLLDDLKREYEVHCPGQVDALIEAALTDLSQLQESVDDGEEEEVPENEPESLDAVSGDAADRLLQEKEGEKEEEEEGEGEADEEKFSKERDHDDGSKCKPEESEGAPSQAELTENT
ncbi:unnamed protein product [Dibothriocephalus latus]|uniref:Uncharacterized protein n=1 Tax=Dibothriocephalus latus TaxID=60516 RepID=A0A3P6T8C4_DIBLA|nr:unnamed protein product [Dibothriocephalus latus]